MDYDKLKAFVKLSEVLNFTKQLRSFILASRH